jgi:ABC-type cobalamin/Fe3+-siderophores transport system ATPase subunit
MNTQGETPEGLIDEIEGGKREHAIHRYCAYRGLVPSTKHMPLHYPSNYLPTQDQKRIIDLIENGEFDEAMTVATSLREDSDNAVSNAAYHLYMALGT